MADLPDSEDSAVQDFLQILEEHRKNCERQGKYVEAEIAKNRLEELREHEENRRREAMRSRQIAERLGVEEAHMLEFQQFNTLWDKRMAEFEQKSYDLDEAMRVTNRCLFEPLTLSTGTTCCGTERALAEITTGTVEATEVFQGTAQPSFYPADPREAEAIRGGPQGQTQGR